MLTLQNCHCVLRAKNADMQIFMSCLSSVSLNKNIDKKMPVNSPKLTILTKFRKENIHEEIDRWSKKDKIVTTWLVLLMFQQLLMGFIRQASLLVTITYKSRLSQKKLYKKTDAIFSIYGRNGINP